jgi:hypothetical protein
MSGAPPADYWGLSKLFDIIDLLLGIFLILVYYTFFWEYFPEREGQVNYPSQFGREKSKVWLQKKKQKGYRWRDRRHLRRRLFLQQLK